MKNSLDLISQILFPPRCLFCDNVIKINMNYCEDCKKYLSEDTIRFKLHYGFDCIARFPYSGIFKKSVLRLKYGENKYLGKQIGNVMADMILKEYINVKFDLVTFIPMTDKKRKIKGYNQAEILAKAISEKMSIKCESILIKAKETEEQHKLSINQRLTNARKTYTLKNKCNINGKIILLVDDIVTTGSTFSECSKMIMDNGAENVYCCAFNRTEIEKSL